MSSDPTAWLGTHRIAVGAAKRFEIGPLRTRLEHHPGEWNLHWRHAKDPLDTRLVIEDASPEDSLSYTERATFPVATPSDELLLSARSADRPIVTRPKIPIYIPSGQRCTIFVLSPIWIEASVGGAKFGEVPTWRPTDTWFGPNPREGQIWYANRTPTYLDLAQVPNSPARAVTRAVVRNDTAEPVPLDRIALPLPAMSIYRAEDGRLWTESVDVHCQTSAPPSTSIEPGSPAPAGRCEHVASPREPQGSSGLLSRFAALLAPSNEKVRWTGPA